MGEKISGVNVLNLGIVAEDFSISGVLPGEVFWDVGIIPITDEIISEGAKAKSSDVINNHSSGIPGESFGFLPVPYGSTEVIKKVGEIGVNFMGVYIDPKTGTPLD